MNDFTVPPVTARRHPSWYKAEQLHEILVDDACKRIATPLDWAVRAYELIAKKQRISPDDAYVNVRSDVMARTGLPFMPV